MKIYFTRRVGLQIIHDNWNFFCQVGSTRLMLDIKFCINTWDIKAVCCRHLTYGVHDAKIVVDHISQLEILGYFIVSSY